MHSVVKNHLYFKFKYSRAAITPKTEIHLQAGTFSDFLMFYTLLPPSGGLMSEISCFSDLCSDETFRKSLELTNYFPSGRKKSCHRCYQLFVQEG